MNCNIIRVLSGLLRLLVRPARAANNLIHHRGTNGRVSAAPAVEEPRVMEIIPADKTADGPAGLLPTVTVLADLGGDMDEETEQ